jgi:hypothetical protein
MEFYTLIELKKEKELAQVIEFEDGQVVAKWSGKVNSLIIHKNLQEFKDVSLFKHRILLREGIICVSDIDEEI